MPTQKRRRRNAHADHRSVEPVAPRKMFLDWSGDAGGDTRHRGTSCDSPVHPVDNLTEGHVFETFCPAGVLRSLGGMEHPLRRYVTEHCPFQLYNCSDPFRCMHCLFTLFVVSIHANCVAAIMYVIALYAGQGMLPDACYGYGYG